MTTLQERLRGYACGNPNCTGGGACQIVREAADALDAKDAEIERLRRALDLIAAFDDRVNDGVTLKAIQHLARAKLSTPPEVPQ
jgi:hypothetical protein